MTTTQIYATLENNGVTPFSNGSEGMYWMAHNCDQCVRSYCSRNEDKEPPDFSETEKLAESGSECFGAFSLGVGFVSGKIPEETAIWMGGTLSEQKGFCELPEQCQYFSQDDRDNPDLKPEPTDPNQLEIPFI